jgi:hypothetical protein
LLAEREWLAPALAGAVRMAPPVLCTTGDANNLQLAMQRWLDVKTNVQSLVIEP